MSATYTEQTAYCPQCDEMTTWTEVSDSGSAPAGGPGPSLDFIGIEPGCEHFIEPGADGGAKWEDVDQP